MHEMGITQQILNQVIEVAKKENAMRINEVRISVGELTEVVEDALRFAFEVLRQDTIAAEAELKITFLSPKAVCGECGLEYEHDIFNRMCPQCGSLISKSIQGHELRIDSIDVDEPDD